MKINQMEALDFRYLLLEYYKKIHLKEDEVMVILMIDLLKGQKNNLITADLLALKMNLLQEEIDRILVRLIDKKFISYDKGMKTSLKPLKEKLYECFEQSLSKKRALSTENNEAYLKNIYEVFEKELGRSLSPVEFSIIQEWIDLGYNDEEIINALQEVKKKSRRITLKVIDKVLLSHKARDDIAKTGYSVVSPDWDKNIEETIEILKTKWVNDDD